MGMTDFKECLAAFSMLVTGIAIVVSFIYCLMSFFTLCNDVTWLRERLEKLEQEDQKDDAK